jgi:PAS domain S-box-containing protein
MTDLQQDVRTHGAAPFDAGQLAFVLRAAAAPMVIVDMRAPDEPIVFANDAFLALTGYRHDEVIGRRIDLLHGEETDPGELARMRRKVGGGEEAAGELLAYRRDGATFWDSVLASPVKGETGEVAYRLEHHTDVSAPREHQAGLRRSREALLSDLQSRTGELEETLEQKTALLHEVDHRVKNNLQLISSLMLLQSRRIQDENTRQALRGMLERVSAIATVHRRLFQSEDVTRFDVAEFVRDLTSDLAGSAGREGVQLKLDLERAAVPASQAAPLALVFNELISNALKHAFPGDRPGSVAISVHVADGRCRLTVEDDGVGMAPPTSSSRGFGLTIVQLLSQQLRAELAFEDAQPGVRAVVSIPVTAPQPL